MKISLVVPHWPLRPELDEMLQRCLRSMDADEKIVIVNDGIGMGKAINMGLRAATGDFIVVANNDTELIKGSLSAICDDGAVTYPNEGQVGAFYCMPRWVLDKVGNYDEQFEIGYYEDTDLALRWQQAGVPIKLVSSIEVKHPGGTTLNTLTDRDEIVSKNAAKFREKWGSWTV